MKGTKPTPGTSSSIPAALRRIARYLPGICAVLFAIGPRALAQDFVHPGLLHTEADFDRMRTKVQQEAQPWTSGWNALTSHGYSQLGAYPRAVEEVTRPGNVAQMYIDIYRSYQCALRWKVSGDTRYADQAVQFVNAWSSTMKYLNGNADRFLAAGIHGYQWANVGEILRTYPGWAPEDMTRFQNMLLTIFYPKNHDFLVNHNGAAITNYWSNWDLCNISSMLAIGVFCDRRDIYDEAIAYIYGGGGNGAIDRAIYHIHPGNLGQMQESGRDQGHTTLSTSLLGTVCEMAWNQGVDLYGYGNNRFLAGAEYVAKYNAWQDVPFTPYMWGTGQGGNWQAQWVVSGAARGHNRPCWEAIYNHYVNRLGLAAPYVKAEAEELRPEGNGSNGDQLGFGTLTFTREPIAAGASPSLTAIQRAGDVVLSWWGSAYAASYHVKRSTNPGGPYVTIATNVPVETPTYTDVNAAAAGTPYYYVVTGVLSSAQETASSNEVKASFPAELDAHLMFEENSGTSAADSSGMGNPGTLANGASWAAGKSGSAVSLDGTNDHVVLPSGIVSGLSDFTIASWVYLNDSRTWSRIFDFGGKPGCYMFLTPRSNGGTTRFGLSTVYNYNQQVVEGPALPTGQWVHVAVTLSDRVAILYINGVEVGRNTGFFLQPLQLGETPANFIGRSQFPADPYLNGRIDDFRIYNYSLSGSAIYGIWGQSANRGPEFTGEQVTKDDATEDENYSVAAQTLASSASDADGNALNFTKLEGPAWLAVAADGALSGTPANDNVGLNTFLVRVTDPSGAGSIARLKINVTNTNDAPVWGSDPLVMPSVTRNVPYSGSLAGNATDADQGAAITFSKVSGPAWLAVAADGTLTGTPASGEIGVNDFTVRATDNTGVFTDTILRITVAGPGLLARYLFDGTPAESLGGPPATLAGAATYVPGVLDQALAFDGTTNLAELGTMSGLLYKDITVAAWVWWDGGGAYQRVFDFGSGTDEYLFLAPSDGTNLHFAIRANGVSQSLTAPSLPTGTWVHLAVTLGGNTATIYVNGVAKATSNAITNDPSDIDLARNYIGDSQYAADPLFRGRIDDFRLYNLALAGNEVAALLDNVPAITPTGLRAAPNSSSVALTWNESATAQSYRVKRAPASGGPYTIVANSLTATTWTDTAVVPDTTYFYVVSASNELGESGDSAEVSAAVSDLLIRILFDESGGASAADSSGNGNDAVLVNAPAWGPGYHGNAVSFAGTGTGGEGQHATLPVGLLEGLSDYTVSCWVKTGAFSTFSRIFDFGTGTSNYMFLTPQYTGTAPNAAKLRFAIRTPSVGEQVINSSTALTAGTWAHVAITRSGNTGTLYVNGVQAGQNTGMTLGPSLLGSTTRNYLGRSQFAADPSFNGAIDDFCIHSRALSAPEISALGQPAAGAPLDLGATADDGEVTLTWSPNATTSYTVKRGIASGGPYVTLATGLTSPGYVDNGVVNETRYYYVVSGSNAQGDGPDSAEASAKPSSLRVHLAFDEAAGNTAGDSSGRGFDAALVNSPGFEGGHDGNALRFAQASSQYATLPAGVVGELPVVTIMCRVKTNSIATWQRIFDFGTGTTNYMFLTTQHGTGGSANKLRFAIRTPSVGEEIINSASVTPAGQWAHVAVVLSGATGRLYLDGVEVGSNTAMTLAPSSLGITNQNYLGKSQWNDPYLDAALDDFRIYSRALTAEEITLFASPLAAPANVEASAGVERIELQWGAVPSAAGYTVKSSLAAGGPYAVIASGLPSTTYVHEDLPPGMARYYVVSAENLAGTGPDSAEVSAVAESALEAWRLTNFGSAANSGSGADSGDADNDGIANLMEYGTGTDPNIPTLSAPAVAGRSPDGTRLTLSFTRIADPALAYTVLASGDLQGWSAIWNSTAAQNIAGTVIVPDPELSSEHSQRFLRLEISHQGP